MSLSFIEELSNAEEGNSTIKRYSKFKSNSNINQFSQSYHIATEIESSSSDIFESRSFKCNKHGLEVRRLENNMLRRVSSVD